MTDLSVDSVIWGWALNNPGELSQRPILKFKDSSDERGPRHRLVDGCPVDQVAESFNSESLRLLAHDKANGIHEVGLAY